MLRPRPSVPWTLAAALVATIAVARLRASPFALFWRQAEPSVYLNVRMGVKPERRDEFLSVIRNNQKGTLGTEPLAKVYTWGEDPEVPNLFHFHEEYIGEAGRAAHNAAPHFAVWEDFVATDPFTSEPVVYAYKAFTAEQT